MFRQIGVLFGIFISLFVLNLFLVSRIYARSEKETRITYILEEFDKIRLDTTSVETAEYFNNKNIKDKRVAILMAFLRHYDSPLYENSELIVKLADQYGIDYRLIPAIAMQESTGCKFIPKNSYNCWGWGIYGNTVTRFSSYPEAIEIVSRGLKVHYIDKGFKTPDEIMLKYNPSSTGSWALGVNTFYNTLGN